MRVLNRAYDNPLAAEEHAAMPLAGGIMQHGYQCGMVWGAALAAGARAYQLRGAGWTAETGAIIAAQRTTAAFRANKNTIDCFDITEINLQSSTTKMIARFLIKGGVIGCFRMAAWQSRAAFAEIEAALSGQPVEAPPAPVSCAALLARTMGASDRHAAMAAGLAGGIGLSGGACGALGAAIWIRGMAVLKAGGRLDYKAPWALGIIERFLKSSDYVFECARIAGREFESIDDHASYLRDGGCSEVIQALATP